ncbi:MAG: RDD family protein [Pseudomonadota bacterium]|nr:RDD family protein [Pseudomonadota bacterium]
MTEAGDGGALEAPSLWRRMASFVYEGMLLFGIGLIPGAVGAAFEALTGHRHPLQSDTALRVITFVIYAIYFGWCWSARGQTLSMQTWQIRVVTADGAPLSQSRALLRFLAACAWFAPATLIASLNHWTRWQGLAVIAVGVVAYALLTRLLPQRQFWHDIVCRTRLVDARSFSRRHNPRP